MCQQPKQVSSLHCSLSIPYGTDRENLINNQELLEWVVTSCILITFILESAVIMYREIRC